MNIAYIFVVSHEETIASNDMRVESRAESLIDRLGNRTTKLAQFSLVDRSLIHIVGADTGYTQR